MIFGNLKSHPPIFIITEKDKVKPKEKKVYSESYLNRLRTEYLNKCRKAKNGQKPTEQDKVRFWKIRQVLKENGYDPLYLQDLVR